MAASEELVQHQYPISSRLYNGITISAVQSLSTPIRWARSLYSWYYPSEFLPDLVKSYECRPNLPIRIFFPKSYDLTSPETLPLIFSIHGGGFCIGDPIDDDAWNRSFSDDNRFLVVALNYRKAPAYPFPTATHDLEALMLAVIADESLPMDKRRVAVTGFSAGGNLSLSVVQLPSIKAKINVSAVLPIYPSVDQSLPSAERVKRRFYKPDCGKPGEMRAASVDFLARMSPIFRWSYVNVGQDLSDPLLSPIYAKQEALPPNVYMVACELDQLAHEAWRMACKLSGRSEPSGEDIVGQREPAKENGKLVLDNERYAWKHETGNGGSVRWLLVPDQVHGFDHLPQRWHGSEEAVRDSQEKTKAYQAILGDWLTQVVWKDTALADA